METQDRIQRPGIASGIRDISAGDPLRGSWLNRIVAGVRAQNQLDFRNPGIGWPALPQMLRAKNVSASAMTPWEAVEITGFNSGHEVPLILEVDSPSAVNVSLGAVTAYRIGAGKVGWVYTHGVCLVQYTGSLSIGDRVGTQSGSGVVAEVAGGLWEVIGTTTIDATAYAVVKHLGARDSGTHGDPAAVGMTAETEAAQSDTWDVTDQGANDGVSFVMQTRTAYDHAGDETLYAYYRTVTIDSLGHIVAISAETRVTIDVPEPCN
jgi:hypothetical protein